MEFESDRSYSEREIDDILCVWKREVAPAIDTDHVSVRRLLVDYGDLERTADGSSYRLGFPPGAAVFDLEVFDIDARATVAAYRDQQSRRRADGKRKHR